MIIGAVVGLGFEAIENILYAASSAPLDPASDLYGALESWGSRMVGGGFVHAIWTAIAGWGIGQALFRANRSSRWRLSRAAGWLLVSIALHWSWNYSADNDTFGVAKTVILAVCSYGLAIFLVWRTWPEGTRQQRLTSGTNH
ncbi:PrsW family intramembrane metalloprotease [Corynebacterium cystitidis]|uniref:PrsW family intramembrane metalloprotease n=1 Tax=Corynebacterium cystitidis TaxID=35757 RepID=UPI00211ED746|nr:PrsW family intramembrane metalloprotease [Corynebacterium cystitidis]